MDYFDESGKIIMPPPAKIKSNLKQFGVDYENSVQLSQVFCPNGHQLIMDNNHKFNDKLGIKLLLIGIRGTQEVFISPYLGIRERSGGEIFKNGDKCEVRCPICNVELPIVIPCDCQWDGMYVNLSLEEDISMQNSICFCNIWGCPNGDIRLAGDIITNYRNNYQF